MGLGGFGLPPPPPNAAATADESNQEWILGVTATFCALALITVTTRVYTRAVLVKTLGLDDWFMMIATTNALIAMICFGLQAEYGLGRHYWTMDAHDDTMMTFISFIQAVTGLIPGLAMIKVSIALSLLRLAGLGWYKWAIYFLIGFVVFSELFGTLTIIFFCDPVPRYWDNTVDGTCYPLTLFVNFGVAHTSFNIFTDFAFATLPIPVIWALQMKKRTRIYVIGVFSLGYLAVIMGIVRAVYQIAYGGKPDSQFLESVQFWGFLQLSTGIIAASAPTLKPLVGRVLRLSSSGYTDGYYGQGGWSAGGTASRRRTRGYMEHSTPTGPAFELDERNAAFSRAEDKYTTVVRSDRADVYGKGSNGSGSEEMILPEHGQAGGITKTTEVVVQRKMH